jgi:hypothetical protein
MQDFLFVLLHPPNFLFPVLEAKTAHTKLSGKEWCRAVRAAGELPGNCRNLLEELPLNDRALEKP